MVNYFSFERIICVLRETDEKTAQGQRESGRRLGERITDTTFWRNEVRTELERLIAETDLLMGQKRALKKAIDDIEGPLHIAQECLYHREKREGKYHFATILVLPGEDIKTCIC